MSITQLLQIEKLRDGGSLVASFLASDSCEYWVMFPIESQNSEEHKFKKPVLINRTDQIEVELTHESARGWLVRLEHLFREKQSLFPEEKEVQANILDKMFSLCTP